LSTPAPDPDLLTALTAEASIEVTKAEKGDEDDTPRLSADADG